MGGFIVDMALEEDDGDLREEKNDEDEDCSVGEGDRLGEVEHSEPDYAESIEKNVGAGQGKRDESQVPKVDASDLAEGGDQREAQNEIGNRHPYDQGMHIVQRISINADRVAELVGCHIKKTNEVKPGQDAENADDAEGEGHYCDLRRLQWNDLGASIPIRRW